MKTGHAHASSVKNRFGTFAAWASAFATIEQLVESGIPALRAGMAHAYPAKMFAQLGFAVLCGAAAGYSGRRAYYWLAVLPLLWMLMLLAAAVLGEG